MTGFESGRVAERAIEQAIEQAIGRGNGNIRFGYWLTRGWQCWLEDSALAKQEIVGLGPALQKMGVPDLVGPCRIGLDTVVLDKLDRRFRQLGIERTNSDSSQCGGTRDSHRQIGGRCARAENETARSRSQANGDLAVQGPPWSPPRTTAGVELCPDTAVSIR
jgi:hypothetical protein